MIVETRDTARFLVALLVLGLCSLAYAVVRTWLTGVPKAPNIEDHVLIAAAYTLLRAIREQRTIPPHPNKGVQ